jgi:hypothetical protein
MSDQTATTEEVVAEVAAEVDDAATATATVIPPVRLASYAACLGNYEGEGFVMLACGGPLDEFVRELTNWFQTISPEFRFSPDDVIEQLVTTGGRVDLVMKFRGKHWLKLKTFQARLSCSDLKWISDYKAIYACDHACDHDAFNQPLNEWKEKETPKKRRAREEEETQRE